MAIRNKIVGCAALINTKKTTQDVIQEEIFRERLAVLVRAGENLADALDKLEKIGSEIEAGMASWRRGDGGGRSAAPDEGDDDRRRLLCGLNEKIRAYNNQREHVRTRYYYLIVTREAMGLIHHERLEEIYRIPPKKRYVSV
jgi:hypothetical protein